VTLALTLLLALQAPPAPAPEETEPPKRYGDQGTSHFGLVLGLGGGSGGFRYAGGVDYGYFVFNGIAPGVDTLVSGGTGVLTTGLILGTLRLLPVRTDSFTILLTMRGGRVLLSDHVDGWGAGGGAAVVFFTGARLGFTLGYDVLKLLPESFCADLSSGCVIHGPRIGIVFGF
jgi:hypothetical protein